LAVANYHDAKGHFPPAYVVGPDGKPWHSWRVLLLPYIEHQPLYDRYDFGEPWDGPNNRRLAAEMPRLYAFHGTHPPGLTTTNYLAVVGEGTMWPGKEPRKDYPPNAGNTVLVAENDGLSVHWMEPRDLELGTMSLTVNHPHGVSSWYKWPAVVTADGTVRRLSDPLSAADLRALLLVGGAGNPPPELPDGRLREKAP
jgi:hypothetical protein